MRFLGDNLYQHGRNWTHCKTRNKFLALWKYNFIFIDGFCMLSFFLRSSFSYHVNIILKFWRFAICHLKLNLTSCHSNNQPSDTGYNEYSISIKLKQNQEIFLEGYDLSNHVCVRCSVHTGREYILIKFLFDLTLLCSLETKTFFSAIIIQNFNEKNLYENHSPSRKCWI